jgi:hypothetical protein
MKRMLMVVALIAAMAEPAFACHRFRVWHYPWPQRCVVGYAYRGHSRVDRLVRPPEPLPPLGTVSARPEAESPTALAPVPPDPGPPLAKEEEQAVSVEQLRKALPSAPTEAQAKSRSTPQPASAIPPSAAKGSDKPKVNDVPVNPLD